MKTLAAILIAVLAVTGVIDNIATVNRLKKEAEDAYKSKEYATAIKNYRLLLDSLNIEDENIRMNLAHAYLMAGDTVAAQQNYSRLINSNEAQIKSVAYQQLGVVSSAKQQYKEALSLFKESLKADSSNEESRYNYELVKKLLQEQQQDQQQQQNQENQDQQQQQNQEQQQNQQGEDQQQQQQKQEGEQSEQGEEEQKTDQQGQEGEQQPQQPEEQNMQEGQEQSEGQQNEDEQSLSPVADKLKEMNISEEKARMILEAMRNSEMQYIQQNRRRPSQPHDRSKPDW